VKNDGALPYFSKWEDGKDLTFKAAITEKDMSSETSFAVVDDGERVDGKNVGTYGILKSYSQQTPAADYPPVNYNMYKPLLDLDQAFRHDAPGNDAENSKKKTTVLTGPLVVGFIGAVTFGSVVANALTQ